MFIIQGSKIIQQNSAWKISLDFTKGECLSNGQLSEDIHGIPGRCYCVVLRFDFVNGKHCSMFVN